MGVSWTHRVEERGSRNAENLIHRGDDGRGKHGLVDEPEPEHFRNKKLSVAAPPLNEEKGGLKRLSHMADSTSSLRPFFATSRVMSSRTLRRVRVMLVW